jgi:hypothetical protein
MADPGKGGGNPKVPLLIKNIAKIKNGVKITFFESGIPL